MWTLVVIGCMALWLEGEPTWFWWVWGVALAWWVAGATTHALMAVATAWGRDEGRPEMADVETPPRWTAMFLWPRALWPTLVAIAALTRLRAAKERKKRETPPPPTPKHQNCRSSFGDWKLN